MERTNLDKECEDLERIIEGLAAGVETYSIEDPGFTLKGVIGYLREFLTELSELNGRLIECGNTPELLKEVFDKYTELWLLQVYCYIDSLSTVVGGLWRYPKHEVEEFSE